MSFLGLIGDILTGFTWWNLGTQLADVVFFFPLLKLAISGYEIFVFVSPLVVLFLGHPTFKAIAFQHPVFWHVASLLGYGAFYTEPALKIGILAITESFSMVSMFARLLSHVPERRERAVYGTLFGLVILIIGRMGFHSLNPWWVHFGGHALAIIMGLVGAVIFAATEPKWQNAEPAKQPGTDEIQNRWLPISLGFGALMFFARWVGSEHGIIARWTSVQPFPSGIAMILSVVSGVLLSESALPGTTAWWIFGGLSSVVFYFGPGPIGYTGGLGVLIYCFSLWKLYGKALYQLQTFTGKTISVALATQLLWIIGTVWVVAYNFVPLGNLARERIYALLFGAMFVVGLPFYLLPALRSDSLAVGKKDDDDGKKKPASSPGSSSGSPSRLNSLLFVAGIIIIFGLLPVSFYRAKQLAEPAVPSPQPPGVFTGMIWTIHFGYDNTGENNFDQVLNLINREGRPEVIGLLESDISRIFTGNRDLMEYLAAYLHYYSDFGPETRENTWGCGLLSLYPILRADHLLMPSITGELACAVDATLDIGGTPVDVIVAHFGNFEDHLDRKLQAEFIRDLVASKPEGRPAIYLGYVVTEPWGENFQIITSSGFQDSAPHYSDRWCEYIFYKNLILKKFKNESVGRISDTEFQWARFQIPADAPKQ
jgi:endonuclease/exonuclease/phosphatase family metal-dependent hydrolase